MRVRGRIGLLVVLPLIGFAVWLGWRRSCSPEASTRAPPPETVSDLASPRPVMARDPGRANEPAPLVDASNADSRARLRGLPESPGESPGGELVHGTRHSQDGAEPPTAVIADHAARHPANREGVREALESAMSEIDECYEDWLRAQPTLGGHLEVRFTIDTPDGVEGRVSEVAVDGGGTGNVAFEGCVLSVVAGLRFEAPEEGRSMVSVPLRFVAPPPTSDELRAALSTLCPRIRSEALQLARAGVAPEDQLTLVLANLVRQTPSFKAYFDSLLPSDVPPMQRHETFKRAISTAIGAPWACPEFEALWDGKAVDF